MDIFRKSPVDMLLLTKIDALTTSNRILLALVPCMIKYVHNYACGTVHEW